METGLKLLLESLHRRIPSRKTTHRSVVVGLHSQSFSQRCPYFPSSQARSSHRSPFHPGLQVHDPSLLEHSPPCSQRHFPAHPIPYVPMGHVSTHCKRNQDFLSSQSGRLWYFSCLRTSVIFNHNYYNSRSGYIIAKARYAVLRFHRLYHVCLATQVYRTTPTSLAWSRML